MNKIFQQEIGKRIRKLRKHSGLTQEKMVLYLHCGRSNYSKIESGQVMAGGSLMATLHLKFNVSLDWLITGKGSMYYHPVELDFDADSEDVRELLNDMFENKAIKHSVLSHFYAYKAKLILEQNPGSQTESNERINDKPKKPAYDFKTPKDTENAPKN